VWYKSRQNDYEDWDYSQGDAQAAVAGTSSTAGTPGEAVTAGFSHSDDYAILATKNSIWRITGDPAAGGSLNNISSTIGIIGKKAWCITPENIIVFLATNGVYALTPYSDNTTSFPTALTKNLPNEFLNIDPNQVDVSLEYDIQSNGINIFLTSKTENIRTHWWVNWKDKTFWPQTFAAEYEPTATCSISSTNIEDSGVVLGGRDGSLRMFRNTEANDCGTAFDNYVMIGPVPLAPNSMAGRIMSISAILAERSGSIDWELREALTPEVCISTNLSACDSGTWESGLNATEYPACYGQAFSLTLNGTDDGTRFIIENIVATTTEMGRRKID
jgi:hypothetical protein